MNLAEVLAQQGYAGNDPFPSNVRQPQPDELATALADLGVGIPANLAGLPVDLASALIRPFGYNVPPEQTVGSTEWFQSRAGRDPNSAASILSAFASPDPLDALKISGHAMFFGLSALDSMAKDGAVATSHGLRTKAQLESDLALARTLNASGEDAPGVWEKTGWFQGQDGKWRFEVDDSQSYLGKDGMTGNKILVSEDFEVAYPDTHRTLKQKISYGDEPRGIYDPASNTLSASAASNNRQQRIALHELQHVAQDEEGFAKGGNVDQFVTPSWEPTFDDVEFSNVAPIMQKYGISGDDLGESPMDFLRRVRNQAKKNGAAQEEQQLIQNEMERLGGIIRQRNPAGDRWDAYRDYKKLAGEVEARNVERRMEMSADDRRKYFPRSTEDVKPEDQVVRYRGER